MPETLERAPGDAGLQVVVADVERGLPTLSATVPEGGRWSGAWVVVREEGEPRGIVELAYDGRETIPSEELRAQVQAVVDRATPRDVPRLTDAELPAASVVVASDLKRPDRLRECLAALTQLDYPDADLIVVDNHRGAAADGVAERIAAQFPRVRVVREAVPGVSAARNAGVRAARGEIVAFTDDDVVVDPGWLRALGTRYVLRPDEDVVTGLILPGDLRTVAQLWFERHYGGFGGPRGFAALTYQGAGPQARVADRARVTVLDWAGRRVRRFALYGAGVCGAGANMSFRKDAFWRLGGFDLSLGPGTPARGGEDLVLFMQLLWDGGRIGFEPRAMVFHSHRADQAGLRQQLHDYGLGFTALLSALVWHDPRHLLGFLSLVPTIVSRLLSRPATAMATARVVPAGEPPLPPDLRRLEPRGMLRGVGSYLHSRLTERRRTR